MAVTFNGPLKVSRPGFTQDGITPNQGSVPNRQAWSAPVTSVLVTDIASGAPGGGSLADVIPAGSLVVGIEALVITAPTASTTLTVNFGTTPVATITFSAIGFAGATVTNPGLLTNTGLTDLDINLSGTLNGAQGNVIITAVLRNADGSLSDEGYRPFTSA